MKGKNWDKDWIHFTKKARRGIFVLLFLFILIAISPRLYHNYIHKSKKHSYELIPLVNDNPQKENNTTFSKEKKEKSEKIKYNAPIENFNPNEYTLNEWMEIGLSEKQANSILKFIEKGGKFKTKIDLKKLYVMNDELYEILEPKILLPDIISFQDNVKEKPKSEIKNYSNESIPNSPAPIFSDKKVAINTANERELQTIKGIGPFFAKEIVKLRDRYGGFINSEQLLDIYNLDQEKLDSILPYINIDTDKIKKININIASQEEIAKHPWITNDMAKSIVFFRENHQKYNSLDELLLSPYIDSKTLKKLRPYLTVE